VQERLAEYGNVRTVDGCRAVVRNGYLPARYVFTFWLFLNRLLPPVMKTTLFAFLHKY
jgi:hypothetical protein